MDQSTGVDPILAGKATKTAESDGQELINAVDKGFKKILEVYETEWGTEDGKNWVETNCKTTMDDLSKTIATCLTTIATKIASTANSELASSSNKQRVSLPGTIANKVYTPVMKDVLANNKAGVIITLPKHAEDAADFCKNSVFEALGKLQSEVLPLVEGAFQESGSGSQVYVDVMKEINTIKKGVEDAMTAFNAKVVESAENADQFASDLQAKGISN